MPRHQSGMAPHLGADNEPPGVLHRQRGDQVGEGEPLVEWPAAQGAEHEPGSEHVALAGRSSASRGTPGTTIASTLLDAGYGVHEVAERLGRDPATLMRYYTRVSAARRLQATNRIAELMTASEIQPRPLRN